MGRDNPIYEARITHLAPLLQPLIRKLLNYAYSVGLDARVIQGFRSFEEQSALYEQGRTTSGPVVTYARPGSSWHNYRLAADIGIFMPESHYIDANDVMLKWLGPVGESFGLRWGGNWTRPDYPHFQLHGIPDTPTAQWVETHLKEYV